MVVEYEERPQYVHAGGQVSVYALPAGFAAPAVWPWAGGWPGCGGGPRNADMAPQKVLGICFSNASCSSLSSLSKCALFAAMYACSSRYCACASLRFCSRYVGGIGPSDFCRYVRRRREDRRGDAPASRRRGC